MTADELEEKRMTVTFDPQQYKQTRFETPTGFEGPCELLVASGTK